jgi:carotenoid cleavage dioxygenase-like enzyme
MIHAVRIKNGTVQYCNRYVKTPRLAAEIKAGHPTECLVGEMNAGMIGLLKLFLISAEEWLDY